MCKVRGQTDRQTNIHTDTRTNSGSGGSMWTDRQTNKHTHRQTAGVRVVCGHRDAHRHKDTNRHTSTDSHAAGQI